MGYSGPSPFSKSFPLADLFFQLVFVYGRTMPNIPIHTANVNSPICVRDLDKKAGRKRILLSFCQQQIGEQPHVADIRHLKLLLPA